MKNHIENLKTFASKSKRVWFALKKPTKDEFYTVTKVSAIGIAVLGIVGFIISILMSFFS